MMSIPIRVPAPYLPNVRDLWVSSISTASLIFWLVRDKPAPCVYFMVLFYSFYSFFFFFCFLISILPIILVRGTNGAPQGTPLGKRDSRREDALSCLKESGAKGYSDACLYLLFRAPPSTPSFVFGTVSTGSVCLESIIDRSGLNCVPDIPIM